MTRRFLFVALVLNALNFTPLFSQCVDGNQPECSCSTAPVLCTVDSLDGYMFSMSSFQHPMDGPTPLCQGTASVPNNPTWFAFTAWCTNLTLICSFSNCTPVGGINGVQIAIYEDCTFSNEVACNVAPQDCNTDDKTLNLTGLNIGDVYYFLVDGCNGAYCDVTIDVVGTCGVEEIDPWTMPIMGNLTPCAGDSETYTVEDLDGAATYHWYVDNLLVDQTNANNTDISFPNSGTFQLCVDASNDPCVPETTDPMPLCTTLTVYESDAGMITINPNPLCPDDVANISVSNYNMGPDNSQLILITDQSGNIIEIIPGANGTFTHPDCETFLVYSYNYIPAIGTTPMIGDNVNNIDCAVECCDLESEPISFEDDIPPQFQSPPADQTHDCIDLVPPLMDLTWNDNCDGTGTVPGNQNGMLDSCTGGTITRMWEYTDACGNTATHTQSITVTPVPPPSFVNPPSDIIVDCDAIPANGQDLNFTNNGSGACLISGTVSPTQTGSADVCGGTITYNWTFTDQCGNTINHSQTVTVNPAPPPAFVNPPADMTVDCDNIPTGAPDLSYTNNESGICLISGMVSPTQSGSADICGGTITYTWTFTDQCGNTINHSQNVTVDPADPPTFDNLPADMTVDCDNIPTGASDLSYTNNENGACLISGMVSPTQSGSADICGGTITYTWTFTDQCGNTIDHSQNITVDPADPPIFQNPPADITVTCDNIPPGPAPNLSYTNNESGACLISGMDSPTQSGSADICGGTITYNWTFTDQCGNTINHSQNVTVEPADPPMFLNPPADITVDCNNIPAGPAPNLNYTNNGPGACLISGTVSPTQTGSADICGGTITYNWTFTDQCGNTINHSQNVTVDPADPPNFINPPADITVDCDNIPTSAPNLSFTNNGTGNCLINGNIPAVLQGNPTICGGSFNFVWQFTDQCNNTISHTQTVTIQPASPPVFLNPPANITVSCDNIPTSAPNLNYTNNETGGCLISGSVPAVQSGGVNECGGVIIFTWTFTDQCGNFINHTQNVTVDPAPPAVFTSALPQDITVSCNQAPASPPPLFYNNGATGVCQISGSQPATQAGSYNECGGTLFNSWQFTDACGRTISHQQTITVLPAPPATFNNPPGPITINCSDVPPTPPSLSYSNGQSGPCSISGSVTATESGFYNECGGTLTYTWLFIDNCNRLITHSQDIQVNPASDPVFLSPPQDITIDCGEMVPPPADLIYSNNESGPCLVADVVSPTVNVNGLVTEYTWTYINPCNNNVLTHTQTITQNPAPDIMISPDFGVICEGDVFDLSTITIFDQNNTNPTITYHSGSPASPSNQFPSPIVNPPLTTTYYLLASNSFGCTDEVPFEVFVETPPFAGNDGFGVVCFVESFNINLFNYLQGNPLQTGTWTDPNGYGVNLSNPYNVNMGNFPPGTYTFEYVLNTGGVCPSDVASVTLELIPDITIDVLDIACSGDLNFYEVEINTNGNSIVNLDGNYTDLGNDMGIITDIPINDVLNLVISHPVYPQCFSDLSISPPDCNCPNIPPPVSNGNVTVCQGDTIPDLSVTVGAGESANWYEDAAGNTLLLEESLSFSPVDTLAGTYIYYTETIDTATGCASSILTPVQLEILALPTGMVAQLETCDNDGNGFVEFDLSAAEGMINTNPLLTFSFFEFLSDAQNNINPLPTIYTNTSSPTQTLFVRITNTDNCFSIVELNLNILPPPSIDLLVENEVCVNNGNGSVTISSEMGTVFSLDSLTWTLDSTFNNLNPGNYTAFVQNANNCVSSQGFIILPGLEILLDSFDIQCDANGTVSDDTDDFYTITILTSANNGSTNNTYDVLLDSVQTYNVFYDSLFIFTLPANGDDVLITIADNQNNSCQIDQLTGPLDPCSDECDINIDSLTFICNDNGTITNPGDDFYEIVITASALNPGSFNSFEVFADNISQGVFNYSSGGMFTIPADGLVTVISVSDVNDIACTDEQTIGPLEPCAEECTINTNVSNIVCDDNGTGSDPTDDIFTFDLLVTGQNNGSGWEATDGSIVGSYNITQTFGPYPIAGGTLNLEIEDLVTDSCLAIFSVDPPNTCSDDCLITIDQLSFLCNNNGTITDPGDDFYDITIEASAINPGALNAFEVFVDNISQGIFDYDIGATFTLPADGMVSLILVQDANSNGCTDDQTIGPLEPCDEDCTINATISNIICNDNGTGSDPADDTFTFDLFVTGQNTGSAWQATDGTISGSYGTTETFGPFSIAGGTLDFEIQDLTTGNCTTTFSVDPPNTCSDDCVISIDALNFICNDNGTITDPSDDFYEITIQASAINPGASNAFEVFANNISQGVFNYSSGGLFTLPADGSSYLIFVQDADDPVCTDEQTIGPLVPCDEECIINASVSNIICDNAGTGNTPDDDTFIFNLQVTGQNTGSGWEATNGTITGSYGTVETFGPFLIIGGTLSFDLEDLTTPGCIVSVVIDPPAPCSSCNQTIDAGLGSTITCTDTIVQLTGSTSAPGNFQWTGPNSFSATSLTTTTDMPGWYFLTGSFPDNCSFTDSVFIDLSNTLPTANAGPDHLLTCDTTEVQLEGSLSTPLADATIEWTDQSGTVVSEDLIVTVNAPGVYTLLLTDSITSCFSSDEVEVFEDTNIPSAAIYADPDNILDCIVSSILLYSDYEENVIYSWNSVIAPEIIIGEPGTINLIALDTINGCENTNQITINDFQDYPFVQLNAPDTLSCYTPSIVLDGSDSQVGSDIVYSWYDSLGNPIANQNEDMLTVTEGGWYYFELVDTVNGCSNQDSVFVESLLDIPFAESVEDVFLNCAETQATFNLNILSPTDHLLITWTSSEGTILSGSTTANPVVDGAGSYLVTLQDTFSGCVIQDIAEVVVDTDIPRLAVANIIPESCLDEEDGQIIISDIEGGQPPYAYSLNNQPVVGTGYFNNLSAGLYDIEITDANGCQLDTFFTIQPGIELELDLPEVLEIIKGQSGTIEAIINVPEEELMNILWYPQGILSCDTCLITTIKVLEDESFQLLIVHKNGCFATALLDVKVIPQGRIFIPNVFSPDADGTNDYFTLYANDQVEKIEVLSVFDRWGELVFHQENFNPNNPVIGWDGSFRGKDLNPAVYVYYFKIKMKDGTTQVISGDITLIR